MVKKITSFTHIPSPEGDRISYTVSEINTETGEVTRANDRKNIIVFDSDIVSAITTINTYLAGKEA